MNDAFFTRRIAVVCTQDVSIPTADGSAAASISVSVPALRDPVDGEIYLTQEALHQLDDAKARAMGLLLPEEICDLRKSVQLTESEIAALLRMDEKTWQRWESGRERPSRTTNLLIEALRDGCIDVDHLRSLAAKHARSLSGNVGPGSRAQH